MGRTRWTHKCAQRTDSHPPSRPGKRLKRTAPPRTRRTAPNRALVSPSPPPPENPSSPTEILKHMIQARNNTKQRLSLPYFGLISRLLEHLQVDCSVDTLTSLAPLSLTAKRRLEKSALELKGRSWHRIPIAYQVALDAALKDNIKDSSYAEPVARLSGNDGTATNPSSTAQHAPVQADVDNSGPQNPLEWLEQKLKELRVKVDLLLRHFGLGGAHTLPAMPDHAAAAASPVPPPSAAQMTSSPHGPFPPLPPTHAGSSTPVLRRSKSF